MKNTPNDIIKELKYLSKNKTNINIFEVIRLCRNERRNDIYQFFENRKDEFAAKNVDLIDYKRLLGALVLIGIGSFDPETKRKFNWNYYAGSVADVVLGKAHELKPVPGKAIGRFTHRFLLRSDMAIDFGLPLDLAESEKIRIIEFIKLIPTTKKENV